MHWGSARAGMGIEKTETVEREMSREKNVKSREVLKGLYRKDYGGLHGAG